jgi:hybrid cluster-associated redox disulfide protein
MITKEMTIAEILRRYPQTIPILKQYGLDCADCQLADIEELEHGAGVHHADLEALLAELNRRVTEAKLP